MRIGLVLSVIGLLLSLSLAAYGLDPGPDDEFEVDCHNGVVTVTIGDHEVGMAHVRFDGEDNTWHPITLEAGTGSTFPLPNGKATFVDVWVVLDGKEVDLMRVCTRENTTTTTTTTTRPTTTTVTTATTTTTSTTVPPATTTTTSLPTSTTVSTSTTTTLPSQTSTTTSTLPLPECDEDSPLVNPDTGECELVNTGITQWTWPIGLIGAALAVGGAGVTGLAKLMGKGYEFDLEIRIKPPPDGPV